MVRRPYQGPRVDVEELAPTARPVGVITHPPGIMRRLQLVPVMRDRPVRAVGDQGQSAQNVMDRDNVDNRVWLRLIQELGSRVGNLPPPVRQPPAGWSEACRKVCTKVHIMLYFRAYVHSGEHWHYGLVPIGYGTKN